LIARSGELAARHPEQLSDSARSSSIFGDRLTTELFAFGFFNRGRPSSCPCAGNRQLSAYLYGLLSFEIEPLVNRLFKRIQGAELNVYKSDKSLQKKFFCKHIKYTCCYRFLTAEDFRRKTCARMTPSASDPRPLVWAVLPPPLAERIRQHYGPVCEDGSIPSKAFDRFWSEFFGDITYQQGIRAKTKQLEPIVFNGENPN
jgi:hypothetical protein